MHKRFTRWVIGVWECLFAQLSADVGSKYVSAHSNLGVGPSASGYRKKGGTKIKLWGVLPRWMTTKIHLLAGPWDLP